MLHARNTLVQLLARAPTPRATMHSVTDRRTDGRTTDVTMPIAGHTVYQYDRLKSIRKRNHFRSGMP